MAICIKCHTQVPDGSRFCPNCGAAAAEAIDAPAQPAYATLADRFLAQFLDGAVAFIAFVFVGRAVATRYGGLTETGFEMTGLPALLAMSLVAALLFFYFLLLEGAMGATLGKVVAGIKVSSLEGDRPGMRASLIRNLLRLVDGIGVYLVAAIAVMASRRRQRLGDIAAGTIVVKSNYPRAARLGSLVVLAATFIGGILFLALGGAGRPAEELRLADISFTEGSEGPQRSNIYSPGEKAYMQFNIYGYRRGADGRADVRVKIDVRDLQRKSILSRPVEFSFNSTALQGRPIPGHFNVSFPQFLPPGSYTVDIAVEDRLAGKSLSGRAELKLKGEEVAPTSELSVQRLRFADRRFGQAKPEAAFRPGSKLWIGFYVTGFTSPNNHIRLEGDLEVLNSAGEVVYTRSGFEIANARLSYVPPALPVWTDLDIPAEAEAGEYQARVTVRDGNSGQSASSSERFVLIHVE